MNEAYIKKSALNTLSRKALLIKNSTSPVTIYVAQWSRLRFSDGRVNYLN